MERLRQLIHEIHRRSLWQVLGIYVLESVDPASVGRDAEKLSAALDVARDRRSSGMLILHDGRIMAERYWEIGNPPVWLEL